MSGNMVLNVEILGEFKKLTAATTGASKDLNSLKKTTDKISKGMKTALAAIGLGFSLSVVVRELKEASKAAIEDVKSQELLALSLQASTKATDNQIAAVEKIIGKYQMQAAVADDELRPAFAKLTQTTGDLEESSKLLGIALDVSAGSGKSLDAVTQAMSRALNGLSLIHI
jgi:50S ribosomal subunit-associated GTPase HflX